MTKPSIYRSICIIPTKKLAGNIVLTSTANVGLQVLNTGHNITPSIISPLSHTALVDWALFVAHSIPVICINLLRKLGNNNTTPNTMSNTAEAFARSSGNIPSLSTKNLTHNVRTKTVIANDNMITRGRLFLPSMTDPQTITGSIGRTQGARIVTSHATNERIYKDMFVRVLDKVTKCIKKLNILSGMFVLANSILVFRLFRFCNK